MQNRAIWLLLFTLLASGCSSVSQESRRTALLNSLRSLELELARPPAGTQPESSQVEVSRPEVSRPEVSRPEVSWGMGQDSDGFVPPSFLVPTALLSDIGIGEQAEEERGWNFSVPYIGVTTGYAHGSQSGSSMVTRGFLEAYGGYEELQARLFIYGRHQGWRNLDGADEHFTLLRPRVGFEVANIGSESYPVLVHVGADAQWIEERFDDVLPSVQISSRDFEVVLSANPFDSSTPFGAGSPYRVSVAYFGSQIPGWKPFFIVDSNDEGTPFMGTEQYLQPFRFFPGLAGDPSAAPSWLQAVTVGWEADDLGQRFGKIDHRFVVGIDLVF